MALENGKGDLLKAIRLDGLQNPIAGPAAAIGAKLDKIDRVYEALGSTSSVATNARTSISNLNIEAASLVSSFGTKVAMVESAADISRELQALDDVDEGCSAVHSAMATLSGTGAQLADGVSSALDDILGALEDALGAGWDALPLEQLTTLLSGAGLDLDALLAPLGVAAGAVDNMLVAAASKWQELETLMQQYVTTVQIDRLMDDPCLALVVNSVAGDSIQTEMDKIRDIKAALE